MGYSYTGMPTPPRRLPTLSPSSARLRRLAPSPVKVVPITPLILTPPRFQDSFYDPTTCTTKDEAPRQSLDDPFEYDFTPLEKVVIMSSDARGGGEERRYFESPKRTNRNASTDSNASVPLIFDSRGDFGVLAEKHRRLMTSRRGSTTGLEPDVPEEEVDEFMAPTSGPASGSRERVVFRDDVFSSSTPVAQKESSYTAADLPSFESDTTISSLKRSEPMTRLGQLEREDSIPESNYTFGRPSSSALEDRRPSVSSVEDDDGWSYTLSAYGDEDDLAAARRMSILSDRPPGSFDQLDDHASRGSSAPTTSAAQIHPYAAAKVHRTSTSAWSDSTASTRTELFTPDYTVAPLPTHCHRKSPFDDSAESPTSTRLRSTIPLPPSPRSGSSLGLVVGHDAEKIDNTPKQTRTLRHSLLLKSPLPAEPIGETPTAHSAKHLNVQVSEKRKSSAGSSSTTSTTSYPEHIVNALKAIDKSTTLSLYVDQEGTREVQTTLKYMKMHKPQVFRNREMRSLEEAALWCESPTRPEPFQQTGCIEFGMDPKARAKWNFHHAALEGLPVLRRLTLSGDEKHDYLSRGATLQIRDTGVYAVFGHEDKGRIEWKFEYLVQPRISASTGEVVPNEKIIIPLGFYVSPNFFNPDRALKLHLLNVFKKQLTPNIVAEKVKPPHIGTPPAQPSQPSRPATAQPTAVPPTGGSGGSGGSGAMSRTLNTIAKAVTGSRTSTPLSMDKDIPPFGSKTPLLRTHPSKGSEDYSTQVATPDSVKSDKKGARKRATSLFSRSRPFTPPVNTDLHPVPKLTTNPGIASTPPLASKKSAMSLRQRPHTAQGPVPPIPPAVTGTMAAGSPLGQLAPTPSKAPTSRTLVPMKSTPSLKQPRYRPHTSDANPMPFASHPTYTASMTPDSALLAYSVRHSLGAHTALSASAGSDKTQRSPHPFSTHVTVRRPSTAGGGTGDGNPKLFGHLRTGSTSRRLNPLTARDPNVLHRADLGVGYGRGGSNDAVKGSRVVIGHNDHMVRYNPHGGSALTPPPRSDSAESLKVPSWQGQKGGMISADGGGGLSPAPRPRPALRKRPSTADPRS